MNTEKIITIYLRTILIATLLLFGWIFFMVAWPVAYNSTGGICSQAFKSRLEYHGIGGEKVKEVGGKKVFYRDNKKCKF